MIFVLSVLCAVGGVLLWVIYVSSCRCFVLVFVVHPVVMLSVVFCVTCILLICVSDFNGDHMVETYSSMRLQTSCNLSE